MEYLQYLVINMIGADVNKLVLNLVISGIPSIQLNQVVIPSLVVKWF